MTFLIYNNTNNLIKSKQVTSLVHMPNGKVYDPLVGQWMSPQWEGILARATEPQQLHLYRFNGNDPINVMPTRQYLKGMLFVDCLRLGI